MPAVALQLGAEPFWFGLSELAFETSLTGEVVRGLMPEVARDAELARYCMAPAAGGCDAMTVSFRQNGASPSRRCAAEPRTTA